MTLVVKKSESVGAYEQQSAIWTVEGTAVYVADRGMFELPPFKKRKTVTGWGFDSINADEERLLRKHGIHGTQTIFPTRRAALEALEALNLFPQAGC